MKQFKILLFGEIVALLMSCGKDKGIDPLQNPPVVNATAPDSAHIDDTITITATASDNGSVKKFIWMRVGSFRTDTTVEGSYKTAFSDTGRHVVRIFAVDNDNVLSWPDSCVIFVTSPPPLIPPKVKAMAAASVNINDSITLTATATGDEPTAQYAWAKNGSSYADTTSAGSWKTAFPTSDRNVVRVKAMGKNGAWSLPDSILINVTLDAPLITGARDTVVSKTMSVTIHVSARDTNRTGSIQKYFWDIGANGWDDSTTAPEKTISNPSGGTLKLLWAARDDDGVFSKQDMITLRFNNPPSGLDVLSPGKRSWTAFNFALGKGTLPLSLSARDTDGIQDTLTYTLFLGASAADLKQAYSGKAPSFAAPSIDSGAVVFWRLKVTDIYGDSTIANDTFASPPPSPPGMALIASGTFQMGQAGIEEPAHSVTVSSFWMDTTEVTQADFLAIAGVNPSNFNTGEKRPVEMVSWFDAARYCNMRSKRDGLDTVYDIATGEADLARSGYRLPTEAQWEYACRAGTTTEFYFDSALINDYAWSQSISRETQPVAKKIKNAFGLYDMSGNVLEWCNDWYVNYASESDTNPTGPATGAERVCRGGSYNLTALYLRCAYRFSYSTSVTNSAVGFRVVMPARK